LSAREREFRRVQELKDAEHEVKMEALKKKKFNLTCEGFADSAFWRNDNG